MKIDLDEEAIHLARKTMPKRDHDAPLFRLAWHARIFALIVTLVKDGQVPWPAFQERLISQLNKVQSADVEQSPEEIDLQYFDCWLLAAEETLSAEGFANDAEVKQQISEIQNFLKNMG